MGNTPDAVVWDDSPDGKGMRFQAQIQIRTTGGHVSVNENSLSVDGANSATIILTAATSFNGFDKSPSSQGKAPGPICARILDIASKKRYAQLRRDHVRDYRQLFGRVTGLCARGGYVVDIEWKDGRLAHAVILSRLGGSIPVRFRDRVIALTTHAGEVVRLDGQLNSETGPLP
jgi:alpha-L-fucosidase 2